MHAAFDLTVFVHEALDAALACPPEERTGLLAVFADDIATGEVSEDEVKNMLLVFVSAGSETTAGLLATATEALARDADLQACLRAEPEGIADFLEDTLRTSGPFQFHYRYAPADTTLGGVAIPTGSRVLMMWAAANRPAPGGPADGPLPPHYAFGKGMHFCIGAPIARMEARLALEHLLARTSSIELVADDPPTRRPSIFMRRHARLPVVLTPA
jgi:cytochrome P450